jgi:dipeptidyl aminopeptidase/acylaminoacyl peptidase
MISYPEEGSSVVYALATNGEDKRALWTYDIDKKIFLEKVYADNEADISGPVYHYDSFNYPGELIGIRTSKAKPKNIYFGSALADQAKAAKQQIEKVIPNSYLSYISAISKDSNSMIIYNVGPKDPGSYYLLTEGELKFIGSKRPSFKAEDLADVKYLKYKSRDGRTIPAYVTIPKGKGPYPLIVMPHGGPFVSETIVWDTWSQLLASYGYMVIQPQYRGSTGYGIDHYTSAFVDGGQGGYKMQDDKDDGVKFLIDNGLVDKDRVAMFGWSYGGYAALVAASREDQLYQCVVSGAPVAKNTMQLNYYRNRLRGTGKLSQEKYWLESISPINEVEKVNVPILLIHGAQDQRVPITHALEYVDKLKEYDKEHKYIQLEGADHFSNTLFYNHKKLFFTEMRDFLKNDCGPDGL